MRRLIVSIIALVILVLLGLISKHYEHAEAAAPKWTVTFTSYNPVRSQTDSDPCTGASGVNQCHLAKTGVRIIALSQELVGRSLKKPFHYGDRVTLSSDVPQCRGEFVVLDTMAARHRKRGDLFFLNKKQNIGCVATIQKLIP